VSSWEDAFSMGGAFAPARCGARHVFCPDCYIRLSGKTWCVVLRNVSLATDVVVERVGDDLMVVIPGKNDVVSLSGRPAEVLLDVKSGKPVDAGVPVVADLVGLGMVSAPGLSRR